MTFATKTKLSLTDTERVVLQKLCEIEKMHEIENWAVSKIVHDC